jgi:hypothetical protein
MDASAKTIAGLRAGAVQKPHFEKSLDFRTARIGMTPPEILAHQVEPHVEQLEGRPERIGDR